MATLQCQKCKAPLKLDGSLVEINPASFKILSDAAPILDPKPPSAPRSAAARERRQLYDEVTAQAGPPLHRRVISPETKTSGSKMNPDMSYIMLSESQLAPEGNEDIPPSPTKKRVATPKKGKAPTPTDPETSLSREMESTMRLFEILSSRSDIDHPICSECTELLLDSLEQRQTNVIKERDGYVQFLKQAQQDVPTDEEKAKTKHDLEDARRREKHALEELESLEAEKARMEDEIAALDAETELLDDEEERFWLVRNAFSAELTTLQSERDSLQNQLAHDTKILEALQKANVYNDTFCIGHDGIFGTINGLRLGRQPDHPVDWPEINAAWGQTLLMLSVVAEKLGVVLRGFELVPVGSTSKVVKIESSQAGSTADGTPKKTIFELYSSGDLPLGLGFLHRNFDNAMVAFLECLRQVGEHVRRATAADPQTKELVLPYPIVKDKIGDVSIKLGNFGQEEQWTKACKYTLTCCKFLLAHTSHIAETTAASRAK